MIDFSRNPAGRGGAAEGAGAGQKNNLKIFENNTGQEGLKLLI
jgi:hypothetical protein